MGRLRGRSRFVRRRARHVRRFPLCAELLEERTLLSAAAAFFNLDSLAIDTSAYDSSRLLVQLDDGAADASALFDGFHFNGARPRFGFASGLYEVSLSQEAELNAALEYLRGQDSVLLAEPDYRIRLTTLEGPDDPHFPQQWALHNEGQTGGIPDADINAPEGWQISTGSHGTVVAVIDTGIDYTHPDLAPNMWVNYGEVPFNGVDDDGNGYVDDYHGYDFANDDGDPMDDHGHGTHVAGIIGAVGNNGIGIAGVVHQVRLMALKFLDAGGNGYLSNAARALDYAVAQGAHVSNHSWGGGEFSQFFSDAIARAQSAGHVVVAAAGNTGDDLDANPSYPASYPHDNIVAVAATDHNDELLRYSNTGQSTVDLAAPGEGILSTLPGGSYGTMSGTSMAAPHVSGAIAWAHSQNPGASHEQLIDQILGTVEVLPSLEGKVATSGRLQLVPSAGDGSETYPDETEDPYADDDPDSGDTSDGTETIGQPLWLAPDEITTDTTPEFAWTAAESADYYELIVFDAYSGETVIYADYVAGTTYTDSTELQIDFTYEAWVRGWSSSGGTGPWSDPLQFTVVMEDDPESTDTTLESDDSTSSTFSIAVSGGQAAFDVAMRSDPSTPLGFLVLRREAAAGSLSRPADVRQLELLVSLPGRHAAAATIDSPAVDDSADDEDERSDLFLSAVEFDFSDFGDGEVLKEGDEAARRIDGFFSRLADEALDM